MKLKSKVAKPTAAAGKASTTNPKKGKVSKTERRPLTLDSEGYPMYLPEMVVDQVGDYDQDLDGNEGIEILHVHTNGDQYFQDDQGRDYIVVKFAMITKKRFDAFKKVYKAGAASDDDILVMFKRTYVSHKPFVVGTRKPKMPKSGDRAIVTVGMINYKDGRDLGVANYYLLPSKRGSSAKSMLDDEEETPTKPVKKSTPKKAPAEPKKPSGVKKVKTQKAPTF